MSEDPSFLVLDPSLLSDPQQLNAYSYGRNNPISYRDTDGKKVELVTRPVMGVGAHAFILITNTPGNAAKLVGVPSNVQDASRITLGGYATGKSPFTVGTGNLYKGANKADDYNLPESKYIERTQILAPSQYNGNQTAFENAILDSYNNLGNELGAYSPFGYPITSQGNSNNTASSVLIGAGVDRSVVQGYRPTSRYPVQTPGLGTPLPSNQRQSIADGLRGLVSTLTAIRDSLKSHSKNKQ